MQLHEVVPFYAPVAAKRIGRGGKRGKTSGKGGKGQTARAGARPRPEMRDFIKKLPKLRGHGVNRARGVNNERKLSEVVNRIRKENFLRHLVFEDPKTNPTQRATIQSKCQRQ